MFSTNKLFGFLGLSLMSLISLITFAQSASTNLIVSQNQGVYSVPVNDKSLEPFANFSVIITQRRDGNKVFINFKLPAELVGTEKEIILEGIQRSDELKLIGEYSEGICKLKDDLQVCSLKYNSALNINKLEVSNYLRMRNLSSTELQMREEVALQFSNDPIGILIQKLKFH